MGGDEPNAVRLTTEHTLTNAGDVHVTFNLGIINFNKRGNALLKLVVILGSVLAEVHSAVLLGDVDWEQGWRRRAEPELEAADVVVHLAKLDFDVERNRDSVLVSKMEVGGVRQPGWEQKHRPRGWIDGCKRVVLGIKSVKPERLHDVEPGSITAFPRRWDEATVVGIVSRGPTIGSVVHAGYPSFPPHVVVGPLVDGAGLRVNPVDLVQPS